MSLGVKARGSNRLVLENAVGEPSAGLIDNIS